MTSLAQEALVQPDDYMSLADTCRALLTNRSGVATYVFEGRLHSDGSRQKKRFLIREVLELKAELFDGGGRPEPVRLPKQQHGLLELLRDWGGAGDSASLARATTKTLQALLDLLTRLEAGGYVLRPASKGCAWTLTKQGWDYVSAHAEGRM